MHVGQYFRFDFFCLNRPKGFDPTPHQVPVPDVEG